MKRYAKSPEDIEQPGVMIYFDIKNCIKRLDLEEIGQLFVGILDYAENLKMPNFLREIHSPLCVAWDVIQPKIDNDKKNYFDKCESRAYAAYCRYEKEKGRKPIPKAEWKNKKLCEREV